MSESDFARNLSHVNIEDEMRQSYMDYAMSVIVGRALPDVRDGLKPVHRRVLFLMKEMVMFCFTLIIHPYIDLQIVTFFLFLMMRIYILEK